MALRTLNIRQGSKALARLSKYSQEPQTFNRLSVQTSDLGGSSLGGRTSPFGGGLMGGSGFGGGFTSSLTVTEVIQFLNQGGACDLIPEGTARDICRQIAGILGGGGGGNGNGGFQGGPGIVPPQDGQLTCPDGRIKVGDRCVDPGAILPGGQPFVTSAGGRAVQGGFGLPAIVPQQEQRVVRSCPTGMVLGKDNLCYPKAILRRRSKFRKWKGDRRPKISAAEWRTLKKAERVRGEAKEVAKTAGWKVTKK